MNDEVKKGGISVQTEHIFPVIKRWLYSDKEIFLRELVSNACDAITKQKRLISLGEIPDQEEAFHIDVILDEKAKTLTVQDNGIGMTEDEVEKFINQIALSGALDFIQKYENESGDSGHNGIIGHFGLGFYSAFMVAEKVEIKTKSFCAEEQGVHWIGSDEGAYEMKPLDKKFRGTEVVLHISEDEKSFLQYGNARGVLQKYCAFMPEEIYLYTVEEGKKEDAKPVNDTHPLWLKTPSDITEEEYQEFYKNVFSDFREPLFHIQINADYPLNFKGILYFPRLAHEYENLEGKVKLFYNQVFVADNIKEVIPEYLLLLKGVLDCPELPLNVSRSYLQSNGYVEKISAHISKKISDKLISFFRNERSVYEGMWDDIRPFVQLGCMRDKKFMDRMKDAIVFRATDESYLTIKEYLEDKTQGTIYYVNDSKSQVSYIRMFQNQGKKVIVMESLMDSQFINFLEEQYNDLHFVRVDSALDDVLKEGDSEQDEELIQLFKEALGDPCPDIKVTALKDEKIPAIVTKSEQERRFADMMKVYQARTGNDVPPLSDLEALVLNEKSPIIQKIKSLEEKEMAKKLAHHVYMLALLASRPLKDKELETLLTQSVDFLEKIQ
ncbi:MAG TPA: molecular chaperone HtpG [Clostridiales bacterium]|nr:molecular chaperone HtpG [Clostridiales bacterium]